jgi:NOL1/NOP2/fmu family ribosome biogenesis protein
MTEWQWKILHEECVNSQKIWPHKNDTEWFFIAKIIKKSPTNIFKTKTYYEKKNEEIILKGKELKILYSGIKKRFWIDNSVFSGYLLVKKGQYIEIRTKQSKAFSSFPMIQNMGIPFWEISSSVFALSFYSAQVFGKHATSNTLDLQDSDQAEAYRTGKDLNIKKEHLTRCSEWQVIVTYDTIILGTSLLQKNGVLKNQVPRETIKI